MFSEEGISDSLVLFFFFASCPACRPRRCPPITTTSQPALRPLPPLSGLGWTRSLQEPRAGRAPGLGRELKVGVFQEGSRPLQGLDVSPTVITFNASSCAFLASVSEFFKKYISNNKKKSLSCLVRLNPFLSPG